MAVRFDNPWSIGDVDNPLHPGDGGYIMFPNPDPSPTTPVTPTPLTPEQQSAYSVIRAALAMYGLESLGKWAYDLLQQGVSEEEIYLRMVETDEYKAAFPMMDMLRKQGRAMSEVSYITYRNAVRSMAHDYGLDQGVFSNEYIGRMMVSWVDVAEFEQRIQMAAVASQSAPESVRAALKDTYGMTDGDLVTYWLDPDEAMPVLQRRFASASVMGAAIEQQVTVDRQTAERLASQGVSMDEARSGFGQVANWWQFGTDVSQADLVGAAFGDANAIERVRREGESRAAQFMPGGGFASTQAGASGIGTASSR
jgi:hypothetical protein